MINRTVTTVRRNCNGDDDSVNDDNVELKRRWRLERRKSGNDYDGCARANGDDTFTLINLEYSGIDNIRTRISIFLPLSSISLHFFSPLPC